MPKITNFNDAMIELANRARAKKALDDAAFDLNAAPYSTETTLVTKFSFKGLYLAFDTAETKTAALILVNGAVETVIWQGSTASAAQSIVFIPDKEWDFPAGCELKLTITQASGACTASILLLTSEA